MQFQFRPDKAIQATGVLLTANGGAMEYIRLLKLLYVAERELLLERGMPFIGGKYAALEYGPLHSSVYDLIKDESTSSGDWNRFFKTTNVAIEKIPGTDPGVKNLTRREVQLLKSVTAKYENTNTWELVEDTHRFSEWAGIYPAGKKTSVTITPKALLLALGIDNTEAENIIQSDLESAHLRADLDELCGTD